jgi:para-nitrobenzyl esterase
MLKHRTALLFLFILCCTLLASINWSTSASRTERIDKPAPLKQLAQQNVPLSDPFITEEGPVRGEVLDNSIVFRGIPYAAAPTGDRRWRQPQPADKRADTLNAISFGSICAQPDGDALAGSEDCLSLNIWAAKAKESKLRPVMFFIHGGGNVTGSSIMSSFGAILYNGKYFAEKTGVVVVTINYRLGPFGYFAHPGLTNEDPNKSSGNYGLLDQIFALQWVQRNIANFGGDPTNVTIFGESAGGRNVLSLVVSPLASGLFTKAIIESGAPLFVDQPLAATGDPNGRNAEDIGLQFAKALGCDTSSDPTACLRTRTPAELLKAMPSDELGIAGLMYGPNVDGYVIPASTTEILRDGQQNNVPIMIGTNKNEFLSFIGNTPISTEADYLNALTLALGDKAPQVLAKYPVKDYGTPRLALDAAFTDLFFLCPARTASQLIAANQPKTFVYQFTHALSVFPDMGAFHGLELPFLFHSITDIPVVGLTKKEVKLSDRMAAYWSNFAKNGDPNGSKLPNWPIYTVDGDKNITLDTKIKTNTSLRKEFCQFLADTLSNSTAACACSK